MVYLGKKPVAGCIACGKCCSETGKCDLMIRLMSFRKLDEYDGIVVGSPVFMQGPSGQVCAFLDRLFFLRWKQDGRSAGSINSFRCRRGRHGYRFDQLNKYFGISNMHIVGSPYWNQVHGNTPEGLKRDEEGLRTMELWLRVDGVDAPKYSEAGRKAGVEFPKYERRIKGLIL